SVSVIPCRINTAVSAEAEPAFTTQHTGRTRSQAGVPLTAARTGGVSEDQLARECRILLGQMGLGNGVSLYTLRSSVTTSMECAKLPFLELRYLTSHTVNDILNHYVGLDPVSAMRSYYESIQALLDALKRQTLLVGL